MDTTTEIVRNARAGEAALVREIKRREREQKRIEMAHREAEEVGRCAITEIRQGASKEVNLSIEALKQELVGRRVAVRGKALTGFKRSADYVSVWDPDRSHYPRSQKPQYILIDPFDAEIASDKQFTVQSVRNIHEYGSPSKDSFDKREVSQLTLIQNEALSRIIQHREQQEEPVLGFEGTFDPVIELAVDEETIFFVRAAAVELDVVNEPLTV